MTPAANSLVVPDLLTFTLGLLVYFVGVIAIQRVAFLTCSPDGPRHFNRWGSHRDRVE
jgi:hypothetical protein